MTIGGIIAVGFLVLLVALVIRGVRGGVSNSEFQAQDTGSSHGTWDGRADRTSDGGGDVGSGGD